MRLFLSALVLAAAPALAQEVRVDVQPGATLDPDAPLTLTWTGTARPAEGSLVVLVGTTDWTELFVPTPNGWVLESGLVPLPLGDQVLSVLVVGAGGPREVLSVPFRVQPALPRTIAFDLTARSQFRENHQPEDFQPGGGGQSKIGTFNAVSAQASYDVARRLGATTQAKFRVRVVGASLDNEHLRFRDENDRGPAVDLATWSASLVRPTVSLSFGEVSLPEARHLLDGGNSRGVHGAWKRSRFDVQLLGTSGTPLVGWDDPLGFNRPEHRLLGGVLGLELLPTAGTLRVEVAGLDGAVSPRPGVNRGAVQDAEESRGVEARLLGNLLGSRLRVDGSSTRSRWNKRFDAELEGGLDLAPLAESRRGARFGKAELDVLRGVGVAGRSLTLTALGSHERVDTLYRSVGSQAPGDQEHNIAGVNLGLDSLTVQVQHTRQRDNLDEVTSILTTRTRRTTVGVGLPAEVLVKTGTTPPPYLPALSYTLEHTLQRGDGIPDGSDFTESQVPDQASTSHNASATWTLGATTVTYNVSRAFQDNRQPTRETADFLTSTHAVGLNLVRGTELSLGAEIGIDRNENREEPRVDTSRRATFNGAFQRVSGLTLQGAVSLVKTDDDTGTSSGRTLEADGQAGWRFNLRRGHLRPTSLLFLRASTQRARALQPLLQVDADRRAWQLAAGLTFSAF